jgi:hypothetical protein
MSEYLLQLVESKDAEIERLRDALLSAREKLAAYYDATNGEYPGGLHYGLLFEKIDAALRR